jgi:hypothetical protein
MIRTSTTIWIVAAVVIAGAGIGVASVAAAHPRAHDTASTSTPRPTVAASTPAPTTPAASPAPSSAPSPSASVTASPSASATAAPSPSAGASAGTGTGTGTKKVSPSLSYYSFAGQTLTLGGGVSGLVESGGTCTVTVTNGPATVTQAFPASPGPSSTDCGEMAITSSKLSHGQWSVTIAYSSAHAAGTSSPSRVTL